MVAKKLNQIELAQKIHASRINVTCMHTNFGERSLSDFRDFATFKFGQISLPTMAIVHGSEKLNRLELAQKIHASRD